AVLAYSGGLDTTCCIAWLKEDYGFDEVVAVLVDVGQEYDLREAQGRGYAAGADDVLLVDRKHEFANEQVAKALKTNALYEGRSAGGCVPADRRSRRRARSGGDHARLRGGPPGLGRRRGARPRRPRPGAQRARRRVRSRADRHDREPRSRYQEPRAVRGAGRARADR